MRKVVLGSVLRTAAVVGFIAVSLTAAGAAAEQATLQVRNGPTYSGELIEYVPGDHVLLNVGPGKSLRFAVGDLVSFDIGAPASAAARPAAKPAAAPAAQRVQVKSSVPTVDAHPQPAAAETPARKAKAPSRSAAEGGVAADVPSDLVRAAAVNALLNERADWQGRDTNLAAPVLFTVVGVIATAVGAGLQVAYQNSDRELSPHPPNEPAMRRKNSELNAASLMTFVTGGVLLGSGFALWVRRTSDARRNRELERIDAQLQTLGVQAALTPWVQPSAGSARGLSAGLNLHVAL